MSFRSAARTNGLLLAGLLLFAGWIVLTALTVVGSMGGVTSGEWVGQHGVGGLVGLLSLLVVLLFVAAIYGELGESEPVPEEWPKE